MSSSTMADDRRLTKHGFPKGFRFVPTHLELFTILSRMVRGGQLHPTVAAIFHEVNILDYHPDELHAMYERYKEHRFIYFFSERQLQRSAQGGPVNKKRQRGAGDEDDNGPRPVRLARGGGWKPSGGGIVHYWPKDKGGFVAGKAVTMVFYDHTVPQDPRKEKSQDKSQWGMHEYTVPLDPRLQLPKPVKSSRVKNMPLHGLALYRLYRLKDMESDDGGAGSSNRTPANVAAAYGGRCFSAAPYPARQPSPFGMIFNGQNPNQPLAAGSSTSRMPPQHHMPNVGHPQFYQHQYAFGAARASAAHQQARTMTMPPAYGAGMLPAGGQVSQYARPPGTGMLPGRQALQFARPPAPSQTLVLRSAANPASHQQASMKTTYGGAGQGASHSGDTRSLLPSASASMLPPAAESPSAKQLGKKPMTATTHGGAGQEAGSDFGVACSSSATGSRPGPVEQDATAMAEPGQHVQFADSVIKPDEETVPPPIWADNNDGIRMMDYDFDSGVFGDNCLFTFDELYSMLDEPPPTHQGDDN